MFRETIDCQNTSVDRSIDLVLQIRLVNLTKYEVIFDELERMVLECCYLTILLKDKYCICGRGITYPSSDTNNALNHTLSARGSSASRKKRKWPMRFDNIIQLLGILVFEIRNTIQISLGRKENDRKPLKFYVWRMNNNSRNKFQRLQQRIQRMHVNYINVKFGAKVFLTEAKLLIGYYNFNCSFDLCDFSVYTWLFILPFMKFAEFILVFPELYLIWLENFVKGNYKVFSLLYNLIFAFAFIVLMLLIDIWNVIITSRDDYLKVTI